ncbi:hypothetical protein ACJIZ3_022541 [Penstemon smallii]|uniref:Inositol-tetrakisphosphate 1-kinase n=1 Tax=Penstemon smallii TaxID=265156 RepID=A0ABD3TLP6_9LAMI
MAEKATRYTIGYALEPKKIESFIKPSLVNLSQERGIDLIPIQLTKPLIDQGPFDCIIHKSYGPQWTQQLQEFRSQYPNVVVVDPPSAIERLHNRNTMLEVVDDLKLSSQISIKTPLQVFVESPESLSNCVKSKSMNFPVIAKPLSANGSVGSHEMCLVFSEEGLEELKLKPPFVLQEFVNHGGVIFKVYVAGNHVKCVKRKSLPDISKEKLLGVCEKVLPFSQISNLNAYDHSDERVEKLIEEVELPPLSFVNEVASVLRKALGLNLFNFDMIRDSRFDDCYLIIDINYFPGYAKMPGYETILTDFFIDVVQKKKQSVVCDVSESV